MEILDVKLDVMWVYLMFNVMCVIICNIENHILKFDKTCNNLNLAQRYRF